MGEGGAVLTNRAEPEARSPSRSATGAATAGAPRAATTPAASASPSSSATLPLGYDHKYVYSHLGYNLKATDMQAAIGAAQLERLAGFVAARRRPTTRLCRGPARPRGRPLLPEATPGSEPCWFGFAIDLRPDAGFTATRPGRHLDGRRHRDAPAVRRQPAAPARPTRSQHRVLGSLEVTDHVAERTFWIGCYPGLTKGTSSTRRIGCGSSAVARQPRARRNPQSAVRSPQSAVRSPQSAVRSPRPQSAVRSC